MSTFDIVSLAILGVLIIVGVIYCLKNKEKVGKFLRSLKSEFKKIVWPSKKQVINNTLIVIAAILVIGAFIWGLDALLSLIVSALANL